MHRLTPRVRLSCTVSTPVIEGLGLDGSKCKYQLLAKDGVFLPVAPRTIVKGLLASGNRADVLINCPVGDYTFESNDPQGKFAAKLAAKAAAAGTSDPTYPISGVLLHIHSVDPPGGAPPQCDLPVFEVNRPCCDWPPFEPGGPSDLCASPDPVFTLCSGQTSSTCAGRRWTRTCRSRWPVQTFLKFRASCTTPTRLITPSLSER